MSKPTKQQDTPPTESDVQNELLAYWDADTYLTLNALGIAYAKGNSLNDVGILANEAESYVNKYNSVVFRMPGKGPLVKTSEAMSWASKPMTTIVKEITKRAQP
jgi:hypothetical protein